MEPLRVIRECRISDRKRSSIRDKWNPIAANNIKLPDPTLSYTAYFQQAAVILDAPENLPDRLSITLATFAQMVSERSRKTY